MCNAAEHAFKEKSAKLLILLPLRTIYFQTFQCETPCITEKRTFENTTELLFYPIDLTILCINPIPNRLGHVTLI